VTPADVRGFREKLGLSQSGFAKAVGVSFIRTVGRWEYGERCIPGYLATLAELAESPAVARALRKRGLRKP
jgi:DNA-binding transcriptional regulator YiaG